MFNQPSGAALRKLPVWSRTSVALSLVSLMPLSAMRFGVRHVLLGMFGLQTRNAALLRNTLAGMCRFGGAQQAWHVQALIDVPSACRRVVAASRWLARQCSGWLKNFSGRYGAMTIDGLPGVGSDAWFFSCPEVMTAFNARRAKT
jgi:hypothetical protein